MNIRSKASEYKTWLFKFILYTSYINYSILRYLFIFKNLNRALVLRRTERQNGDHGFRPKCVFQRFLLRGGILHFFPVEIHHTVCRYCEESSCRRRSVGDNHSDCKLLANFANEQTQGILWNSNTKSLLPLISKKQFLSFETGFFESGNTSS